MYNIKKFKKIEIGYKMAQSLRVDFTCRVVVVSDL